MEDDPNYRPNQPERGPWLYAAVAWVAAIPWGFTALTVPLPSAVRWVFGVGAVSLMLAGGAILFAGRTAVRAVLPDGPEQTGEE